jgi:hypothetical protein
LASWEIECRDTVKGASAGYQVGLVLPSSFDSSSPLLSGLVQTCRPM